MKCLLTSDDRIPLKLWMAELYSMIVVILLRLVDNLEAQTTYESLNYECLSWNTLGEVVLVQNDSVFSNS